MDKALQEYRKHLIDAEQKAQEDFDKTVISLSGGALGVSFAFVKDIVGEGPLVCPKLLLIAWTSWGLSVTSVLASYYASHLALRKAIEQIDNEEIPQRPGGVYDRITAILNACGGILFVMGVILIVIFVSYNLGG